MTERGLSVSAVSYIASLLCRVGDAFKAWSSLPSRTLPPCCGCFGQPLPQFRERCWSGRNVTSAFSWKKTSNYLFFSRLHIISYLSVQTCTEICLIIRQSPLWEVSSHVIFEHF